MLPKKGVEVQRFLPHHDLIFRRIPHEIPIDFIDIRDEKIVFLNQSNLDKVLGYKAAVILIGNEIHIVITGFSKKGSKALYDSIEKMKDEEIYGK